MRLNCRIKNWQQAVGAVYLFNGALLLALAPFGGRWRDFAFPLFALWIGHALWRYGCAQAAQTQARVAD